MTLGMIPVMLIASTAASVPAAPENRVVFGDSQEVGEGLQDEDAEYVPGDRGEGGVVEDRAAPLEDPPFLELAGQTRPALSSAGLAGTRREIGRASCRARESSKSVN